MPVTREQMDLCYPADLADPSLIAEVMAAWQQACDVTEEAPLTLPALPRQGITGYLPRDSRKAVNLGAIGA
jgi:hypothetical protein